MKKIDRKSCLVDSNNIQDVRILTLCKHHYLDRYTGEKIPCDYSSWGYYDGIIVGKKIASHEMLFEKLTNSCISQIWSGIGTCIEKSDGTYSKQNIGIFRCKTSKEDPSEEFWSQFECGSPYFTVSFANLKNSFDYVNIKNKLESKLNFSKQNSFLKCLVYYTFDNADIIIFNQSNSLDMLSGAITKLEEDENFAYVHSIMGVSEKFLECCETNVISYWNGMDCHIKESLSEISINIVTSGEKDLIKKIGFLLKQQADNPGFGLKNYTNMTYAYVSDHKSIVISIPNTDVQSLLGMMKKGGFITHENPLYNTSILNIETEIKIQANNINWSDLKEPNIQNTNVEELKLWCGKLIEKYKRQIIIATEQNNEGMIAYWRALIQTLNTLSQYEGFETSKSIFYLLYPVLKMFTSQLDEALVSANFSIGTQNGSNLNKIKKAIDEFITDVNAVIYHTVHTDQVFLMIPGYTGTTYSIPLKLCLFYQEISRKIIYVLNDKPYQYNCFLVPRMEARTVTKLIQMGVCPDDRLISFLVSQRILYRPRHFILILTHELAHYVGAEIRDREYRKNLIIELLSLYLAEGMIPSQLLSMTGIEEKKYELVLDALKIHLINSAKQYLENIVNDSLDERKLHSLPLEKILNIGCREFLGDEKNGAKRIELKINEDKIIKISDDNFLEVSSNLHVLQEQIDHNRLIMHSSDTMGIILSNLISIFKEIFSDTIAFALLQCDFKTYIESFDISEGGCIKKGNRNMQEYARKEISRELFTENSSKDVILKPELSREEKFKFDWPNEYHTIMYEYEWLKEILLKYAKNCKEKIKVKIESKNDLVKVTKDIRDSYCLFFRDKSEMHKIDKDEECLNIYNKINENIREYETSIREEYSHFLKNEFENTQ